VVSKLLLSALVLLSGCAATRQAQVSSLERDLAAQPSATAVLTAVCQRRFGPTALPIRAEQVHGGPMAVPSALAQRLDPGLDQPVVLRHVRLMCGETVLSEAYNWYLPMRLPVEVARLLETTDTPFGKALAIHGFTRKRLWSKRGRAAECPAGTVLSQSAVLELPERGPVSLVIECYGAASLGRGH
jgi:chorismate-pyruvate lyase